MEKIRILIVDDCSAVRNRLKSILQAYPDMEVVGETTNGLEAIAEAEQRWPDVILVDAQMSEMEVRKPRVASKSSCPTSGSYF